MELFNLRQIYDRLVGNTNADVAAEAVADIKKWLDRGGEIVVLKPSDAEEVSEDVSDKDYLKSKPPVDPNIYGTGT